MRIERLVDMANDIAAFFAGAESEAAAPQGVVDHLQRFWTPAMLAQLVEHVERGGSGLSPVAAAAAQTLASRRTA